MDGIINIYKPAGMTSHDVVNKVRRIAGTKKVGHTGTLDPDAEGVLPICINRGTKVADMLTVSDKRYTATFRLGLTTDTLDIGGTVLEERPVNVTQQQIVDAIESFVGVIEQIPPMYSAIKVGGKKLCDLARKGVEVERKSRTVEIYEINILDVKDEYFTIDVKCSKGTYIRTLGSDIGEKLGCGAVMTGLIRTQSSIFKVEDAVKLEDLTPENYTNYVTLAVDLFEGEKITVDGRILSKVLNGNAIPYDGVEGNYYKLYDDEGKLLCLSKMEEGMLKVEIMFCVGEQ